jgi:Domain of unknown function (DUF1707)
MVTGPDLRAGDADRDAAAATLREHYAQGRLSLEEFNQRLDAAFAASTHRQLSHLTRDLPQHDQPAALPASPARPARPARPVRAREHGWYDGQSGYHSGGRRSGSGLLPTLVAVLASWFLLIVVIAPQLGAHFPWPGRLGILIAIFTIIRGLLRRIFRGHR